MLLKEKILFHSLKTREVGMIGFIDIHKKNINILFRLMKKFKARMLYTGHDIILFLFSKNGKKLISIYTKWIK